MAQSTALRLLRVARPYAGLFLLGLGATALASALEAATVVVLAPLLKALFGTVGPLATPSTLLETLTQRGLAPLIGGVSPQAAAGRLVLLLVAALLIKNAFAYASHQLSVAVQEGLVHDLRVSLFRHLLTIDLGFFQRTKTGQLIAGVISDADQCKLAVTAALAAFFQNLVLIVSSVAILATISWRLSLLTLATAPILVLGIKALTSRLRRHARRWADQRGELTARVAERLGAIRLIRASLGEEREGNSFEHQADDYRRLVIRTQRLASLTHPVSEVFGGLVVIFIVWAAATPAIIGAALGPEVTIVFLVTALKMMSPVKSLAQFPTSMALALASAERVFALLDRPAVEGDQPDELPARFERDLVFDRVSYAYEGGDRVLRGVSFRVAKGRVVAIVGPSGAGKTTLLDLLPRFHDPSEGEIRMDGMPLTRLSRSSLRAVIGYVSQDTVLLNDTVFANIAYARPGASRAQVEVAARAANAAQFITELPSGYATLLGERGTRLSGGQRQRIAIARALLRDPPILILDEATSALDTASERLVQQAIDRLMKDRTVLVVAHRLATVREADEIVVLDAGRVVERGSHLALIARNGLYRRLYDLEFRPKEEVA